MANFQGQGGGGKFPYTAYLPRGIYLYLTNKYCPHRHSKPWLNCEDLPEMTQSCCLSSTRLTRPSGMN